MSWILQQKDFGLGNFINLTPTIKALALQEDKPVDVFFESEYIKRLFENSIYMNVLSKRPNTQPMFTSGMINHSVPDWKYVFDRFIGHSKHYHTNAPKRKVVCIMNGCANEDKRHLKDVGGDVYVDVINSIPTWYDVVFVGSYSDKLASRGFIKKCKYFVIQNIELASKLIETCEFVVSNDTGQYHLAGAYQKKGFIMWKDTNFEKNKSPNKNFRHSFENYVEEFNEWLVDEILG